MEGTEEDWHRRFLAAGVPLVILALPKPLGWLGGNFTIPLRVTQGDFSSLGVDMFNIGNLDKKEKDPQCAVKHFRRLIQLIKHKDTKFGYIYGVVDTFIDISPYHPTDSWVKLLVSFHTSHTGPRCVPCHKSCWRERSDYKC